MVRSGHWTQATDIEIEMGLLQLGRAGETALGVANRLHSAVTDAGGGGGLDEDQRALVTEFLRRSEVQANDEYTRPPLNPPRPYVSHTERMKRNAPIFNEISSLNRPSGEENETLGQGMQRPGDENNDKSHNVPCKGLNECLSRFSEICVEGYQENEADKAHDLLMWKREKDRKSKGGRPRGIKQQRMKRYTYGERKPLEVADKWRQAEEMWNSSVLAGEQKDFHLPRRIELQYLAMSKHRPVNDADPSAHHLVARFQGGFHVFVVSSAEIAKSVCQQFSNVKVVAATAFSCCSSLYVIGEQIQRIIGYDNGGSEDMDTGLGATSLQFDIAFPTLNSMNPDLFIEGIENGDDKRRPLIEALVEENRDPLKIDISEEAKNEGIKLDSLKKKMQTYVALKEIPKEGETSASGAVTRHGQEKTKKLLQLAIDWRKEKYPQSKPVPGWLELAYRAKKKNP